MSTDDELRARLRAGDPAADLAPADPDLVARLVADVTSTELTTENRATGTRQRSRFTWLVAAAAVAVIALVSVVGLRLLGDDEVAPPAVAPTPHGVTTLTVPSGGAARCALPSAELLAPADLAVDGTVTVVADGSATIAPQRWYAGTPTATVRVEAPAEAFQRLLAAPALEVGQRYLLAANDGVLMVCGFSGPYDEGLAALYEEAFPG